MTGYRLDGTGIESRWGGEIFCTCPDWPWGPPSLLYNGYRVFPRGKERPGCDADPSPPSSAIGHERVELYLYSPYGPYSPVQSLSACTMGTGSFPGVKSGQDVTLTPHPLLVPLVMKE